MIFLSFCQSLWDREKTLISENFRLETNPLKNENSKKLKKKMKIRKNFKKNENSEKLKKKWKFEKI